MNKTRTMKVIGILLLGVMLVSACTQTYSQTPLGTPTLLPTGLFVSPFPSGQDPLKIIAELGTQTAKAEAAQESGTNVAVTGTPATATIGTAVTVSGTVASPTTGTAATAATQEATLIAVTVIPGGSTFTPTGQAGSTPIVATYAPGTVPTSYTLQKGEWPYCIARRFNVNPDELLDLNNLTVAQSSMLMPGLVLSIPKTGNPFPADRAWHDHPDTYTVGSADTTVSGVACYYGDITPEAVANANSLSVSSVLRAGQVLNIP